MNRDTFGESVLASIGEISAVAPRTLVSQCTTARVYSETMVFDGVMDWRVRAACRGADPELFHAPDREIAGSTAATRRIELAKAICAACPVRHSCLEWSLEIDDRFAIMGGMTAGERMELKKRTA